LKNDVKKNTKHEIHEKNIKNKMEKNNKIKEGTSPEASPLRINLSIFAHQALRMKKRN